MLDKITIPNQNSRGLPAVAFHFQLTFLSQGGLPKPLDIRFQKVSGLSAEISPETYEEGGQNLFVHRLPGRVNYGNLVLERGLVTNSFLSDTFTNAFTHFQFNPCTAIVTLLDEVAAPLMSWQFFQVYPVRWSMSDLDANANQLVIETLELAYTRFQSLKL